MKKSKNYQTIINSNDETIINLEFKKFLNIDSGIFDEFDLILNFLGHLSKGKNIFVNSYGMEKSSIESSYIKSQVSDLNYPHHRSLFLREISVNVIHRDILDSRGVILYIFEPDVKWDQFIKTNDIKEKRYLKKGIMIASFSILDPCTLFLSTRIDYSESVAELLDSFAQKGYKIRNSMINHVRL